MEDIKLEFEIVQVAHCDTLKSLYLEIFGKVVPPEYFITKYGLHLPEQKVYSLVGKIEGEIVGFFGAIPQNFQLDGTFYELVLACDFFVQEAYQGKGVFAKFYAKLLEDFELRETIHLYAYQSEQTYKFCKKNNWLDAPDTRRFELVAFPKMVKSVLERALGASWSAKRLEKNLAPYFLAESEQPTFSEENGRMVYTADFLKMKRFVPRYFLEIEGCRLWLKYDYRLTVGWIDVGSNSNVEKMLQTLKKIARRSGIHEVVFHATRSSAEYVLLRSHLPESPSFKVSSLSLKEGAPAFEQFKLHFVDGDLF